MSSNISKMSKMGIFIVALGAIFYGFEYFLRVSPAVMKDELFSSFSMNATMFGAFSAYYFYAYTPLQIFVGIVIDRVNLRYVLCFAVLCCAGGTMLIGYTDTFMYACLGRFLQGFGSAFAYVGALKLTVNWLPAERFATVASLATSIGFWGAAFGEISIGYVVDYIGWRDALTSFCLFGIVLTAFFWYFLRLNPKKFNTHSIDIHHHISWKEMFKQLFEAIKNARIWVAGILSSLIFLPTSVFASLWGVPYLQKLHGYDLHTASLASSCIFIGWALGAMIVGYISDTIGSRVKVITMGSLIAALLSLVLLYNADISFSVVCFLFVLFGMASSCQVLTFAMAKDICSPQIAGTAMAFVNCLAMLGGMIFQRGLGRIIDFCWSGHLDSQGCRTYILADYQHAIVIIPICLFLATLISISFRKKKIPQGPQLIHAST